MPLFRRKGKYNLLSNERSSKSIENVNACKPKDYKCKYEQCERARIQGRPLPSRPARISSGEYATVGSPRRQVSGLYEVPVPLYEAPEPLYGNVTMRPVSSPHIYEDPDNESTAGGTRRRKHASKSTHKKRGYGKRTMRKRGKRTMRKRGKLSTRKRGKRTMRKGGRKMMRGGKSCRVGLKLCVTNGVEQCIYDDEVCEEGAVYASVRKPTPPPINRSNKPHVYDGFDDDESF